MPLHHHLKHVWHTMIVPAKWWLIGSAIVLVMIGAAGGGVIYYEKTFANTIKPGVKMQNIHLGGLNYDQAKRVIEAYTAKTFTDGFRYRYNDTVKTIALADHPEILHIDVDTMTAQAFDQGRTGTGVEQWWERFQLLISGKSISLQYSLNTAALKKEMLSQFVDVDHPALNADAVVTVTDAKKHEYTLAFSEEKNGERLNYTHGIAQTNMNVKNFANQVVPLKLEPEYPTINFADAEKMRNRITDYLLLDDVVLTYKDKKMPIAWTDVATWVSIVRDQNNAMDIALNPAKVQATVAPLAATNIDQAAQDGVLKIEKQRAVAFKPSLPGIAVDYATFTTKLTEALIKQRETTVEVVVIETQPEIPLSATNDFGINELLGTGYSSYAGSPYNRIKNIKHAVVDLLDGILIEPGENFSLLGRLKPFTLGNGYFNELVIKGDKIEPEVGGGLCQVGTTMFRTAMGAGMKITERRNHSLVISYYNDPRNGKPGTDATIYDPSPDMRFLNDTGHWLLLTTELNTENGDIFFHLWGTNDGRKGYYSEPVVLNWIGTGPAKEVMTKELAPGKRKCQGSHVGANTIFTYTRELPDGTKEEVEYPSAYRALPTICLVGEPAAGTVDPSAITVE